jgi:hypothetical protein
MGRKGIGHHQKLGTKYSSHPSPRHQLVQPDEVQADHDQFGTAQLYTPRPTRGQSSTSLDADKDNDTKGDDNDVLPVLKLTSAVVGKERYLFGKGSMVST